MRDLAAEIVASGARVEHDGLPVVQADPVLLGQLFENLVANAVKFRAERPPVVHVSARELLGSREFTVQDNGIGVPPDYADRVFKMFQRLHHRDQYEGTGIGLSVCQRIVERHGGRIRVEPVTGGPGNRFVFLHAEDNVADAVLTRMALDEAAPGFEHHHVLDGEEALRFLRREGAHAGAPRPDLVLLDLNMPRMGGREALAAIKQNPDLKTIPVLVLTTSLSPVDVERSYEAHVNSYLRKPLSFEQLVELMRRVERFWLEAAVLPA